MKSDCSSNAIALADSSNLVYLKRYPTRDVNSDYISAVIVDGLREKTYLTSQLPMPSTLSDFWRLVAEQGVEFIIILQQPDPDDPVSNRYKLKCSSPIQSD